MDNEKDERQVVSISIRNCFDPESTDWEHHEFNFIAKVEMWGNTREAYFEDIPSAMKWATDKVEALRLKHLTDFK